MLTVLPNWSSAVTVTENGEPAVALDGAATTRWVAPPEAGLTAFLTYQPGLEPFSGHRVVEDQVLQGAYFVPGERETARTATADSAVPLGTVDVLVLNEAAGLMAALAGKKG